MIVSILLTIFVILLLRWFYQKPHGLPPGEWGLPIIGATRSININNIHGDVAALVEKHGDIFYIKLGERIIVFLSDFEMIKSAYNKAEFNGRPDMFILQMLASFKNAGVIPSSGKVWQDNRRFSLFHLKDLGMGKSRFEDTILLETNALLEVFDQHLDKPYELDWAINVAVLNVIWGLTASKRYTVDDKDFQRFSFIINDMIGTLQTQGLPLAFYPSLVKFMPRFMTNKLFSVNLAYEAMDELNGFIKKVINEHEKDLDVDNPRDLIDNYLIDLKKKLQNSEETREEELHNIVTTINNLFIAGSETTSTTIRWMFYYMIKFPKVQEKIQKELDKVVPEGEIPTLNHKSELVYLEAAIYEIQRLISLVNFGVPHAAVSDGKIKGYNIPKGTVIFANMRHCHTSPKLWERPNEFYPEHFIDKNGKLNTKKEGYMPFLIGRRACLGESLAKMELYLFIGAILKKYTISGPGNLDLKVFENKSNLLLNMLNPFKVVLKKRKSFC